VTAPRRTIDTIDDQNQDDQTEDDQTEVERMSRTPTRHPTVAERAELGKRERARVPRTAHAAWRAAGDRTDPVDVLEAQAAARVAELVPIRYARMLTSPFAFFRGGAALMAGDLATTPRTGLTVQLCGDAHLSNFGVFAAPDRRLVFSINDFDETLPGPFEWDVKRLAASFAVAGRDRGLTEPTRAAVVAACSRSYREAMREFATERWMELWYARLDADQIAARFAPDATKQHIRRIDAQLARSRSKDPMRALDRLTHVVDGQLRFLSTPPLLVPIEELAPDEEAGRVTDEIHRLLRRYRRTLAADRRSLLERYHYVHLARKVVGVGSVGTRAWVLLLAGRDEQDPLILQVKEAQASVLEPFLGPTTAPQHGQRVVEGQRMMQSASDIMLGWLKATGFDGVERHFYVRQLWDSKGSADTAAMPARTMDRYARLCGWTLARAHARSGDPVAIASYLGSGAVFDRAMVEFAEAYADQNEADHARLRDAADAARVEVAADPA
jgi:uncharacterized protein (DUF2252 family)